MRAPLRLLAAASGLLATFAACNATRYPPGWRNLCEGAADPKKLPPSISLAPPGAFAERRTANAYEIVDRDAAKTFFANAQPAAFGGVMAQPDEDGGLQASVDAFVNATDFTREKIVVVEARGQGSYGVDGADVYGPTITIVSSSCSPSGGTPPPSYDVATAYRIPRAMRLKRQGCSSCGPPVECCPP